MIPFRFLTIHKLLAFVLKNNAFYWIIHRQYLRYIQFLYLVYYLYTSCLRKFSFFSKLLSLFGEKGIKFCVYYIFKTTLQRCIMHVWSFLDSSPHNQFYFFIHINGKINKIQFEHIYCSKYSFCFLLFYMWIVIRLIVFGT